jgi:hypothetical protein
MVMGSNSTNINKTMESLNGDGQQNEQPTFTSNH